MSFKRVSLNLIHYFQDHRQLSRICIKNDILTISDLEKYICDVFNIENRFYLMCKKFYLPSSENIEILDDNDLIYVMPDFQKQTNMLQNKVKSDKKKSKKETNFEIEVSKKKKCKEKLNEFENVEISEKKKEKKEKSKKKLKIIEKNSENSEFKSYHLKGINENVICETQANKKVINNSSYINKELEMELCDNSDKTQNSSKTNLEVDETIINDEVFNNSDVRPRKKRRCISPIAVENATQNIPKEDTNSNPSTQGNKIAVHSVEILNEERQQNITDMITKNPEPENVAQNENECKPQNGLTNGQSRRQIVKTISGLGAMLQNLQENSDSSFQSEDNFITRRRNRIRQRKKKKQVEETPVVESPVFKPPKTIANPKLHIKFDENNENINRNENNLPNKEKENSFVCSTPMKINNNEDKKDINEIPRNTEIHNLTVDNTKEKNFVELTGMPKINDLITFKTLKMGENYNPEISQSILAAVQDITNDQQLRMKILDGKNEFKEPLGRFSCIPEEDEKLEETSEVILALNSLIEPKLCKL